MEKIFYQVFEEIEKRLKSRSLIMAIDGKSASGKTTFCNILKERYQCNVFHMDDFFLRPHQRTKERMEEIGGNVDRERFLSEILIPIYNKKDVTYTKFNCKTLSLEEPLFVKYHNFSVIEGSYSHHPHLFSYYDFSVFFDIDEETQRKRIEKRNGENSKTFFEKWIPLENKYFEHFDIKNKCDILINQKDA